jgi:D-3-phosphoglycerate dehydrogenase
LTCHMGSMSEDCRARMEIEATEEAIRFLRGEPLLHLVPESEYACVR